MYHIKQDKRSLKSAEEIVKGLEKCLETIPFHRVTVADIHRASGVSRATFYRLFDTPEDVLQYHFDGMMEGVDGLLLSDPQHLLENLIDTRRQQYGFVRAVIENGRIDLLAQSTEKLFRRIDGKYAIFPEEMKDTERDYIIMQLAMYLVGSTISWSRSGRMISAAEEVEYLKDYIRTLTGLLSEQKRSEAKRNTG